NVDQEGQATANGVVAFKDVIATSDSPQVASWKRAGAIIVGRTNTPAFSLRWHTDNDLRGRTFNPWHRDRTPGGSSGGAASALAVVGAGADRGAAGRAADQGRAHGRPLTPGRASRRRERRARGRRRAGRGRLRRRGSGAARRGRRRRLLGRRRHQRDAPRDAA